MKKTSAIVLTAGLAMFSMFFGSGNLVYPLSTGVETSTDFVFSTLGLILTAVCVPFLGLIGIILFDGDRRAYFRTIGKAPAFILTTFILLLLGPIAVVPRCILVAYGSIQASLSGFDLLPIFSLTFCVLIMLLIWKHHRIVPILGKTLTPILLLGITALVIAGIIFTKTNSALEGPIGNPLSAFKHGVIQGYLPMDLLAAFFFSATIVEYLRERAGQSKVSIISLSTRASMIGAGLLAIVYIGFVYLGAKFSPELSSMNPEMMLAGIAGQTLGAMALIVAAITITLACLTTATILSMQFAEFLSIEVTGGWLKRSYAIFITLGVSFLVSLVGFQGLSWFLVTTMKITYPALIALAIGNILLKTTGLKISAWAFWLVLLASLVNEFVTI